MPINSTLLTRLKGQWSLRPVTIRLLQLGRLSCYQLTLLRQMAGVEGLEPPTYRLTVYRSTNWTIHPFKRGLYGYPLTAFISCTTLPWALEYIRQTFERPPLASRCFNGLRRIQSLVSRQICEMRCEQLARLYLWRFVFSRKQRSNKLISGASSSHHRLLRMRILFTILP